MSDAESSSMKLERSERAAYEFMELFANKSCECEIVWKGGHPLRITYGSGIYKRELFLYPTKDVEMLEFLLSTLEEK